MYVCVYVCTYVLREYMYIHMDESRIKKVPELAFPSTVHVHAHTHRARRAIGKVWRVIDIE